MNRLSKEKRDRLILVGLATLILLVFIGYGLIRTQYGSIAAMKAQTEAARTHLQNMEHTIKQADAISSRLTDQTFNLSRAESDVATGDPSAWIYDTIRNFKTHYKVNIAVNGPLTVGPVDLLPDFPFEQLRVTVSGTAYYHDLGKFIADFENTFPHVQITNLNLQPAGGAGSNSEELAFRMDIIALVNSPKPPPSHS